MCNVSSRTPQYMYMYNMCMYNMYMTCMKGPWES